MQAQLDATVADGNPILSSPVELRFEVKRQKLSIHWGELDILRGWAGVLMIMNHVGYTTLAATEIQGRIATGLLFVSGFAPALFFFITGVGYGMQSARKRANHWTTTLRKVSVLIWADLFMHWSDGRWLGLDFLGFIGLSGLVLAFVRGSKRPVMYCFLGLISVSIIRYGLGHYLQTVEQNGSAWNILNQAVGNTYTTGVSYPPMPWLAYPFAGYLTGVIATRYRGLIKERKGFIAPGLFVMGVLQGIIGVIVMHYGASSFRWGTVGAGFFVMSLSILLISLAGSLTLYGHPGLRAWRDAFSLGSGASLAIVPVHYFLLYLITAYGETGLTLFRYSLVLIAVLAVSFLLARRVDRFAQTIRQMQASRLVGYGLVVLTLAASGLTLFLGREASTLALLPRTIGQIALCLWLAFPQPSPKKEALDVSP